MTKKNLLLIFSFSLMALGLYIFLPASEKEAPQTTLAPKKVMVKGREIANLPPHKNPDFVKNLPLTNTVSPHWSKALEKSLLIQAGDTLESIKIDKTASVIWIQNGAGLNAEAVTISLKNQNQETSSFKALVDSETGKILETWDRPVVDPINPRKAFSLKLDPRYLSP